MAKRKSAVENVPATTEQTAFPAAEYTVLARRYRPQQFGDLVGQEPIAQVLKNAIEGQRVAHAYLFTGARGVGKTSTARILAKCLNCVKGPTITPCGECDMCRAIAVGEDVDVLEIDGASNNGVEQVRELRQNVNFRPSRSRYKIYIIDEVHMLSTAAFNALLKTLEEPPAHVKFIFATTEVTKIPVTILSRCQRFDFAGIGLERIVERLRQIVASEHMEADDEALYLIARRAGGSMRDAQSLLDQLLSFGSERLSAEQVNQLLGTANEERIVALASAVLEKDAAPALDLVGALVDQGLQLGELLDQLIEYWRDLMIVQCTGQEAQALSVTGQNRQVVKQQAGRLKPDTVLAGLDILVAARSRLRNTSQGRVLIEMALVRLSRLDDLVSLAQLAQWAQSHEGPAASAASATVPRTGLPTRSESASATSARPSGVPSGQATGASSGQGTGQAAGEKKKPVTEPEIPTPVSFPPLTQESINQFWPQVVSQSGFAIENDLRKAEVAIFGPNALVLRFQAGYNHSLDSGKQGRLEAAVRQVFGPGVAIRLESGAALRGLATADAGAPGPVPEANVSRAKRARNEVVQLPLVKKAMDLFGAQIVHLDEEFASASGPADQAGGKTEDDDESREQPQPEEEQD